MITAEMILNDWLIDTKNENHHKYFILTNCVISCTFLGSATAFPGSAFISAIVPVDILGEICSQKMFVAVKNHSVMFSLCKQKVLESQQEGKCQLTFDLCIHVDSNCQNKIKFRRYFKNKICLACNIIKLYFEIYLFVRKYFFKDFCEFKVKWMYTFHQESINARWRYHVAARHFSMFVPGTLREWSIITYFREPIIHLWVSGAMVYLHSQVHLFRYDWLIFFSEIELCKLDWIIVILMGSKFGSLA